MTRPLRVLFFAVLAIVTAAASGVHAQQATRYFRCMGSINGVASEAWIEVSPGGLYTEGPGIAGRIGNPHAQYSFTGTLFGGTEGYVSLVELNTGARIDRVWIGFSQTGFTLRGEDGATYAFQCQW